jgi:hypothetical protein
MSTLQTVALIPAFIAGSTRLRGRRDAAVDALPLGGMGFAFWESQGLNGTQKCSLQTRYSAGSLVAFEDSFSENLPASFQQRQRGAQQITLLIDAPNALWLTGVVRAAGFSGRAARGSVVPRKMACHPAARAGSLSMVQGHRLALEGAAWSLPLR